MGAVVGVVRLLHTVTNGRTRMGRGYLLEEGISGTIRYDLRQSLHDGGGAPQLWAGGLSGQLA